MKFKLNGIVEDNRLSGFIVGKELIKNFDAKVYFPKYQRERIKSRSKINQLKEIFETGAAIDPITLNLVGDFRVNQNSISLSGEIHVIDGQQRVYALREVGADDYMMPVFIHYNLEEAEEVKLFHQLNSKRSNLTFGELAKSCIGPFANVFRSALKSRTIPVKLVIRGSKGGMNASNYTNLLWWAHTKIFKEASVKTIIGGKQALNFISSPVPEKEAQVTGYAVQEILKHYVDVFGEYNDNAMPYKRSFFLAWNHVVVDNFVDHIGHINFKRFKGKISLVEKLLNNSYVRELCSSSGDAQNFLVYNEIVAHMNKSMRTTNRLERLTHSSNIIIPSMNMASEPDQAVTVQ